MSNMWMVRAGKHAHFFNEFKEYNVVSIEWDFEDLSNNNLDEIKALLKKKFPRMDNIALGNFSFQINSFVNKFKVGDYVITVNPENRTYLIGKITSDYYYSPNSNLNHLRDVEWICEIKKDNLKQPSLSSLNTSNAVFQIKPTVKKDILDNLNNSNYDSVSEDDNDLNGIGDSDVKTVRYWLMSAGWGAGWWDDFYRNGDAAIGFGDTGDLKQYKSKEELNRKFQKLYNDKTNHRNNVHACWQFVHDMQIGDVIFVKNGMSEIIGRGIVESDYFYDTSKEYHKIRKVRWTHKGSWKSKDKLPMKTLTDITNYHEFVNRIKELFASEDEIVDDVPEFQYPDYNMEKFLEEVYVDEYDYNTLVKLVGNKKNLIVQGAPGVGKTFMAKRLAYSIMGVKDPNRVMMVQFHQSYSYEDFVMGYRPSKEGFELREGTFYSFCKQAEEDSENDYFFIIDEINRGNLSKIFGELFMLIENDKRGEKNKIQLLYSDESFFIPKNVYIIGLMNTADRSLAMLDYALRRRFAFFDLKPGFGSDGFRDYQENLSNDTFNNLINVMIELNHDIKEDESLGEGFRIGHSYLCNIKAEDADEKLSYIVEYELIPLLKEYWFDESEKIDYWSERLRSVLDD
ncbi:MAG: AAA family ATPase [Methanobrevibacter sp.]|uniref:AAA family ATPase n=1 Tax=Methanobrevibacter sp. TaxID=66852 RepID=UPI0025F49FA2|nr:AAA family ATPase [Methanobrevibacter sp.]MBE6509389.1 AAA family ATPase [Methanobrevibacter sp.]